MSRRRVKIKPKFYLILTFIIGVAVAVLAIALQDSAGGTLKQGSMEAVITKKAVLIRDEMSISVDKYDRMEFRVGEGETVYEGMPRRKQIAEWKKLVREYKKSPPSPEKYRLGFKAAINGFRISGTDIPFLLTVRRTAV